MKYELEHAGFICPRRRRCLHKQAEIPDERNQPSELAPGIEQAEGEKVTFVMGVAKAKFVGTLMGRNRSNLLPRHLGKIPGFSAMDGELAEGLDDYDEARSGGCIWTAPVNAGRSSPSSAGH